jgi:DNA-binding winged helix-turn-helix (wHTH) protein
MIDLPTRKLNLIQYLAQSQDEVFLEKLEQLILKKESVSKKDFVPFTVSELIKRIEMSEKDIKNGNYKTQDELKKISVNW